MDFLKDVAKASDLVECGFGHACQFCKLEDTCDLNKPAHNKRLIEERLNSIDQIILVLANKGGVGKSTVAANVATGLAMRGFRVGVADADIHGPNQSRFFGFAGSHVGVRDEGLATKHFRNDAIEHPIRVGSLAFLLQSDDTPVVWRDAYKHDFIHHLIGSFDWGPLDFLIIDMPPGTGNELITLCDLLEGSNVSSLLVSTPQAVAQMDSLKAARFCNERGMPVLGAVENMAGVVCPHCSESFHIFPDADFSQALEAAGITSLTKVPLDPGLASGSDAGLPLILSQPETIAAKAFGPAVEVCAKLGRDDFKGAVARTLDDVFEQNLEDDELATALAGLNENDRNAVGEEISRLLSGESERLHGAVASVGAAS